MALLDNRIRLQERAPGVILHGLVALLEEWEDGELTRSDVERLLGLDAGDSELTWLKDAYSASTDKVNFARVLKRVLYLAEVGWVYTTKVQIKNRLNGLP